MQQLGFDAKAARATKLLRNPVGCCETTLKIDPRKPVLRAILSCPFFGVEALPVDATVNPGGRRWFDSTPTSLPSGSVMFRSRRTIIIAIALALTMPILYALAAGPLVYMERIGRPVLAVETFLWIYSPLNYAEAKIQPVGLTMQFYIDFWERAAKRHLATQKEKTAQ